MSPLFFCVKLVWSQSYSSHCWWHNLMTQYQIKCTFHLPSWRGKYWRLILLSAIANLGHFCLLDASTCILIIDILADCISLCRDVVYSMCDIWQCDSLLITWKLMTTINVCSFSFPTEIQLKRQERKRRSTCISPQNALDIDPEVS